MFITTIIQDPYVKKYKPNGIKHMDHWELKLTEGNAITPQPFQWVTKPHAWIRNCEPKNDPQQAGQNRTGAVGNLQPFGNLEHGFCITLELQLLGRK